MADSETSKKVISIIASTLKKEESQIKPTDKFMEDLGADSLDNVELLMNLEEEFGIKIQDEESDSISTVGDAIEFVEKILAQENSSK